MQSHDDDDDLGIICAMILKTTLMIFKKIIYVKMICMTTMMTYIGMDLVEKELTMMDTGKKKVNGSLRVE